VSLCEFLGPFSVWLTAQPIREINAIFRDEIGGHKVYDGGGGHGKV
jgi:hypothetical protein